MQGKTTCVGGRSRVFSLHEYQTETSRYPTTKAAMVGEFCACGSQGHAGRRYRDAPAGIDRRAVALAQQSCAWWAASLARHRPTLFPLIELQALQDELCDELAFALARREHPVEREYRQLDTLRFDAPYADTRHGQPHRHFCSVRVRSVTSCSCSIFTWWRRRTPPPWPDAGNVSDLSAATQPALLLEGLCE